MKEVPLPDAAALMEPGTVLLDTMGASVEEGPSLLFQRPVRMLEAWTLSEVSLLLDAMDKAVTEGYYLAGYLAYEAAYAFEACLPKEVEPGRQLGWFGVYTSPVTLSRQSVDTMLEEACSQAISAGQFEVEEGAYADKIAAIKVAIREGEVYQINYTGRYRFRFEGSPLGLYRDLRRKQQVPYAAFIHTDREALLSLSPELFFRRTGTQVVTRPMKGTTHRGRTLEEDEARRAWLRQDEKSRAENLMIVDLLRNDLSVVCRPGSIHVPRLFETETYKTIIQMTSTVTGEMNEGVSYAALFRALFPCGSVTGAPKISAMQHIQRLEDTPRGVYCGAVGFIAPDDRAVFNVAIRTVLLRGEEGEMGTGSGVVWDSEPEAEYAECLLKTRFLTDNEGNTTDPFSLIETMRWAGTIPLLQGHIARMRASAAYFGFLFDEEVFRAVVEEATAQLNHEHVYKVRITMDKAGDFQITTTRLLSTACGTKRVLLSTDPIDQEDPFFFHKTTRRGFYERAFAAAREEGFDEILFLNMNGEVTEGSRSNVFIQVGDRLLTPPVPSGLLGGVYRQHMLDTQPDVQECVLHVEDLLQADALFLTNAVQGLQKAVLDRTRGPEPEHVQRANVER